MYKSKTLNKNKFAFDNYFELILSNKFKNLSPINCIKLSNKTADLLDSLYFEILQNISRLFY